MEDEKELNLDELEDVSGGMISLEEGLALLGSTKPNNGYYYEFIIEGEKYITELGPSLRLSSSQALSMCLQSVYPRMVTFCRSNPHFSHLTETDLYNLMERFSRDMYGRYCKNNWVY